jgi:hypothetical protein
LLGFLSELLLTTRFGAHRIHSVHHKLVSTIRVSNWCILFIPYEKTAVTIITCTLKSLLLLAPFTILRNKWKSHKGSNMPTMYVLGLTNLFAQKCGISVVNRHLQINHFCGNTRRGSFSIPFFGGPMSIYTK